MKKLLYILFAGLIAVAVSCKKGFLDINQNPNAPTENSITPQLLLPRVQQAVAEKVAVDYEFAARWMGYWARSGTYGPSQEEESYNISSTFQQAQWSSWYDILFDNNVMEQKAAALGTDYNMYRGIGKIYKTIGFMYLVDLYNNVPYSKAFDLKGNITPAYDKGEDIYKDLFVQLDSAVKYIKDANDALDLSKTDIVFGGSKTMWLKLANTQRLKLVLRQSQVPGFNPATELAKITSEGFLGEGETAYAQPGYQATTANPSSVSQQNPYWETYKTLYTGQEADQYNRANNYILNLFKNNGDPRYTRVFSAVPTGCSCNPTVTAGSYFGFNYGEVNSDPNQPKAANSSNVAGPALAKSATQPQWFFTSVESLFLQAEAAQRAATNANWTIPNVTLPDPKTAYENAVRESFAWLGLTTVQANNYLTSGNAIVDWASASNKLNLIITQKYLALIGLNNFEAWIDYRRLGIPAVPKSLAPSVGPNIPLRLRYPQAEINYNSANVAAQGNPDVFTQGVFWDK